MGKNKTEIQNKISAYKKNHTEQLSLFDLLDTDRDYSHTIELYDFMPKYVWGKVERVNGVFLHSIEREFECRGKKYKLIINPASLKDKKTGVEKYFYPGKREEFVEDALRKLMADGQGIYLDGEAGVVFTLYQLQKVLSENGHQYSYQQLKDALDVLTKTSLEIESFDGKDQFTIHPIEAIGFRGEEDETQTFAKFSVLVSKSLKDRTFRLVNYEKVMSYKTVIARQLHKRMSHHFTQAEITETYTILLSTIIRDFGLTKFKQLNHNLREVINSLKELESKNVVLNYKIEKIWDQTPRLKLVDAKIIIRPSIAFSEEVKHANFYQKKLKI